MPTTDPAKIRLRDEQSISDELWLTYNQRRRGVDTDETIRYAHNLTKWKGPPPSTLDITVNDD